MIDAGLDRDALLRAIRRVVARHEALRSTFPAVDEAPVLRLIDAEDIRPGGAVVPHGGRLRTRLTELARRPFDLEHGPLFRVHLLRRSASDHVVLLVFHHIIADFLSAAVFLDDLGRAYAEERAGRPGTWPPPPSRHADFVRWQDEMLAGEEGERLWTYWRRQLAGPLPVLELPTDRPRPAVRSDRGRTRHDVAGSGDDRRAGRRSARRTGRACTRRCSPRSRSCWRGTPARTTSSSARRSRGGRGRVSRGWSATSSTCCRCGPSIADDPTFGAFLARVRRTVAEGLEHQDFPFSLMVDRLEGGPDPGRPPIFQVMFAHQRSQRLDEQGLAPFALGVPGARLDLHGLAVESVALDRQDRAVRPDPDDRAGRRPAPARVGVQHGPVHGRDHRPDGGGVPRACWQRSPPTPAEALGPARALAGGPAIGSSSGGPSARSSTHEDTGIHHRFEREAAATPGAPALVFGEESLTYGELNRLANVVAHQLIDGGVGPESVVGLFLERLAAAAGRPARRPEGGCRLLAARPRASRPSGSRRSSTDSRATVLLTEDPLRDRLPILRRRAGRLLDPLLGFEPARRSGESRRDGATATTWPTSSSPRAPRAGPRG